jgi:multidrug transporter EmrE-like cation transporter
VQLGSVVSIRQRYGALFELVLAIVASQVAVAALKASQDFSLMAPTLFAVAGYLLSTFWFARSMKVLPMGFAYALWIGLGMVSSSLIGLFLFGESLSVAAVAGLLLIASGIFVLNSAQEG